MSGLLRETREAMNAFRRSELGLKELASWARGRAAEWLSEPAHRYAFAEDLTLEALQILAASDEAPAPEEELEIAAALLRGEAPFRASRLLVLDAHWVKNSPCALAAGALVKAAGRIDAGEDWRPVVQKLGALLERETTTLAGRDYVELVLIEAAAVCEDLRLSLDGTLELLGPGRPRIDAFLQVERLLAAAQVLAGERPLRATVLASSPEAVSAVLGY